MIYVNFVSETCWQVIFESHRVFHVITQEASEAKATDLAEAAKRLDAAARKFGICTVEQSIIDWQRSLAYFVDGETNAWHNVA